MDNTVTLVGNVTRDPEIRYTPSGQTVATFGLAVNRRWQNRQNNEWEEQTSFFDVKCWSQMAENVSESVQKGTRVIVTGRLEQRSWETDNGDNPPIEISRVRAHHPTVNLLAKVTSADGAFLYYGNDHIGAPHCDLRLMKTELTAAPKEAATLGAEEGLKVVPPDSASNSGSPWLWVSLAAVVANGTGQATVINANWQRAAKLLGASRPPILDLVLPRAAGEVIGDSELLKQLQEIPVPQRAAFVTEFLQQEVQHFLRLAQPPAATSRFLDLGTDSLMAIELRNRLHSQFGGAFTINATAVFDYPTIGGLAEYLVAQLPDAPGADSTEPTTEPDRAPDAEPAADVGTPD